MIKFAVLGSGSKGNSVWVDIDGKQILLDCGFTYKALHRRLAIINKSPEDIKEIYITHCHGDHHGASVKWFEKHGVPIRTEGHFKLSHDNDAPCVGYRIEDKDGNSLVYVTDTGGIPCDALPYLIDANALIIEANHDTVKMIKGPYPDDLKERVFYTHMRNEQTADVLRLVAWGGLEYVVLYHLSEVNNEPKLAEYEARMALLEAGGWGFDALDRCKIVVAKQNEPTGIMVVM